MKRAVPLFVGLMALIGCGQEQLEPCDIYTRACQLDVYYFLQRVRGDGWDPFGTMPPVELITRDAYRARLSGSCSSDPDAEPRPWDVALQLLGVVSRATTACEASVEDRVRTTAAFYSPRDRKITIIDHGADRATDPATVEWETSLLAHEMVHALQDRELGFPPFSGTTNAWHSWRAAIEGEAVLYELLSVLEMNDATPDDFNRDYFGRWLRGSKRRAAESSSSYFSADWLVYPVAARRYMQVYLDEGNAGVRRVFRNRVQDFTWWAGEEPPSTPSTPALSCSQEPPEDFALVGNDQFGAAHVFGWQVADWRRPSSELDEGAWQEIEDAIAPLRAAAWHTAQRWVDDRVWVWRHPDLGVAVEWRVRFRRPSDALAAVDQAAEVSALAVELAEDLAPLEVDPPARRIEVSDEGDLRIIAAEDESLLDSWVGSACPVQ